MFERKIELFPLGDYQPEFVDSGASPKEFVARAYLSRVKRHSVKGKKDGDAKKVFHHFTCATDTGQVKTIFEDVVEIIIAKALRKADLLM